MADTLNDEFAPELSEEDTIAIDLRATSTTLYLDYLSIRVSGISFRFISSALNTKLILSPNRSNSLKLKGSDPRPHYYLPLGKYSGETIFILFAERTREIYYKQPMLLDVEEANAFYFCVAKALARFNKSVYVTRGAQTLLDTNFNDPFNVFALDTM